MKYNSDKIENVIAREIGYAIKRYYGEDKESYKKAEETIRAIRFTNLQYKRRLFGPNKIVVTCSRPGIFIGGYGKLIKHIEWCLSKSNDPRIANAKIQLVEDKVLVDLTWFMVGLDLVEEE